MKNALYGGVDAYCLIIHPPTYEGFSKGLKLGFSRP